MKAKNTIQTIAQSAGTSKTQAAVETSLTPIELFENRMIEERLQQLHDLARAGDEIAQAELDLYFALS